MLEQRTAQLTFLPLVLTLALQACGPASGELGSSCSTDADCKTGACLQTFQGGYCSQRCENAACPEDATCAAFSNGSFCLQNCTTSFIDCRSGYHCADVSGGSACFPDCAQDSDCGAGARCVDKRCQAGGAPGAVGAECRLNVGCQSERCEIAFNGGACTQACAQSGPGSFGQGCPSGSTCAQVSEAGGMCLPGCKQNSDCRADYFCDTGSGAAAGSPGVCRSKCRGSAQCGLGRTCQLSEGQCIEGSALPRQLGASCASDGSCDSSYCLDQPNQQFPGGVCSADCSDGSGLCGSRGLCIAPSDPTFASVCLQKCQTNFDCRAAYFCSTVVGTSERVCLPRCSDVDMCRSPEVCDSFSGDCVPPGSAGSSSVVRTAIGGFSLTGTRTTQAFEVNVPDNALSFTLVLKGSVGGTSTISRLTSPSGELLFDLDNYLSSKVRILPVNDGDFGMLFPNSPRVTIAPGRYRFSVLNENGTSNGEVFALIKTASSRVLTTGKLDLNLWFAGISGLNAANAGTHPSLQSALTEFKRLYQNVGVRIGTIQYYDVPASEASRFSVINTTEGKDSELRQLFELSRGAPNSAMNFFLVDEIQGGGAGLVILGIAGGIPGIPFEQGTNASGVAVTAADLSADPASVARTMAHEGGHWLGLWHTSEQNGQMHDPLSDTPECPASRDTNADERVSSSECSSAGADYLMFWQAGASAQKISNNQGFVLLRNPVIISP